MKQCNWDISLSQTDFNFFHYSGQRHCTVYLNTVSNDFFYIYNLQVKLQQNKVPLLNKWSEIYFEYLVFVLALQILVFKLLAMSGAGHVW